MKMKYLYILLVLISFGCDKDEVSQSPESALLVFPFQDSECTTGISISETLSQVTFEWQSATNAELYVLNVVNLNTNTPQTITTAASSASLSIEKGTPFSWTVSSSNEATDNTAISDNWLFYNAGPQTNYAPFPAQIISPISGSTVQATTANEVVLRWSGADVEDDISSFEIYFGEENPPLSLLQTTDAETMQVKANVSTGKTYFWSVLTTDENGNTSNSGVFDFKVL